MFSMINFSFVKINVEYLFNFNNLGVEFCEMQEG